MRSYLGVLDYLHYEVAGVDIASRNPEAFMTHALNDFGSGDNGHWALLASSR